MSRNAYEHEMALARSMRRNRRGDPRQRGDPRERRATAWSVIVIGAIIAILVLWPLVGHLIDVRLQARVPNLPTASGEVLESRVWVEEPSIWTRAADVDVLPLIRYRYTVDGRTYESSRFAFQDFGLWRDECEAIVADHPPGSAVEVYYHPGDPQLAAISPRSAQLNLVIMIFCGALLLLGAALIVGGLRVRPWKTIDANSDDATPGGRKF